MSCNSTKYYNFEDALNNLLKLYRKMISTDIDNDLDRAEIAKDKFAEAKAQFLTEFGG